MLLSHISYTYYWKHSIKCYQRRCVKMLKMIYVLDYAMDMGSTDVPIYTFGLVSVSLPKLKL